MATTEVFSVAFQIMSAETVVCDHVCEINSALDEQSIVVSGLYVLAIKGNRKSMHCLS